MQEEIQSITELGTITGLRLASRSPQKESAARRNNHHLAADLLLAVGPAALRLDRGLRCRLRRGYKHRACRGRRGIGRTAAGTRGLLDQIFRLAHHSLSGPCGLTGFLEGMDFAFV